MKTPLLKYYVCHRGESCRALKRDAVATGHRIARGPLRGCIGLTTGATVRFGRGYALIFKPVLRVGAP